MAISSKAISTVVSESTRARHPLRVTLDFTRTTDATDPYAFRFGKQSYIYTRATGVKDLVTIDWDDGLLADLETLSAYSTTSGTCDAAVAQRLGHRLRDVLKTTDWSRHCQEITQATLPGGILRPVYITIRSSAAELYSLPWECLPLDTDQHLGELPNVLVRYAWHASRSVPLRDIDRDRILFAWSDSHGAVPHKEHRKAITESLDANGGDDFCATGAELPYVSCVNLSQILAKPNAREPISILHILCHSVRTGDTIALGFYDDKGNRETVDGSRLRQILAAHAHHLRIVILSACDSGNNGALGNHLGSIAQNLHRAGIQTVIASRYPLSVPGSIQFARSFYNE